MLAPATAFYAVVFVVLKLILVWRVVALRQQLGVGVGDGGHHELNVASRIHGNYIESMPLMLVLMFIAEMNGVAYAALHTVGGLFLVSRIGHAWGMHEAQGRWHAARAAGVAGTWLALLGACGLLVYNVLTIRY
ncbi:MAG: MAPEG family protein [Halospina sp.]